MKKNNKYLYHYLILFALFYSLAIKSEELVLHSDPKFIPDFKSRFSMMAGFNPSMTKASQLRNFHFSYGQNIHENKWLDFNVNIANGTLDKMTTNNASATLLSDSSFSELENSTQLSFGIGISFETRYSEALLPFNNMYELITAGITYNILRDSAFTKNFTGPGLIAKYSLLKKFSDFVSIGGNFIYNLAVVKRGQDSTEETSSIRSLTLSHLTVGIDLSFYL